MSSYCPRSSLPATVLAWLATRLAHLAPPRPPGQGGTRPLPLEVRLDAVGAVLLDGLSYRRAGRVVGISKTEVGDSLDLLLGPLAALGSASPTAASSPPSTSSAAGFPRWPAPVRRCWWTAWGPGCNGPGAGPTRRCCMTPSATPHRPGPGAVHHLGDLLWVDGGWPGSCHEHELRTLSGLAGVLDGVEVASLLDRGFRGLAKAREHWHAPLGDRRTIDRLTDGQRAYNREQAGLRALVEQAIAHLANAWALRRWRGCCTGPGTSSAPLAR